MKLHTAITAATCAGLLLHAGTVVAAAGQPDPSTAPPRGSSSAAAAAGKTDAPKARLVDINRSSQAELMKLPGLSAADAQRIIAARPYLSKAHLVTRHVISEGQYAAIRSMIMATQNGVPGPRKAPAR